MPHDRLRIVQYRVAQHLASQPEVKVLDAPDEHVGVEAAEILVQPPADGEGAAVQGGRLVGLPPSSDRLQVVQRQPAAIERFQRQPVAVFIGVLAFLRQLRVAQPPPIVVTSQGPTIARLEKLSSLVTSKVHIADVLVGVSEDSRGAFLIRGDALVGVDLSKAVIVDKDDVRKQATIQLPQPRVILARVDHEKSRVWEFRTTTWVPWHTQPGRLLEEAMLQAQRMVTQAANSPENIEQARRQAEVIIAALYEHLDWHLTIVWQETPTGHAADTALAAETCQR